ncbi:MAG: aminotransferase class I/II-fold pyridoxal phosphate-dependent enzyme [Anaerolineaceae bacterium]|nr:MAG: aminotransferase class I/II-fold pyridoxal phosphate-dependent enzyme [Anaerolineaceae bacterium]
MSKRIYLSPPHMSGHEIELVQQAFADNWIAPVGPQLNQFEADFAQYVGAEHAVALASGTAAIHLALLITGIQPGDEVMVSTLTFAGSINPIIYTGARPILIDSEPESWNIDPNLIEDTLKARARSGNLPKAIIPVHLYGQSADMDAIMSICERYGVLVIEDAAESLGSRYKDRHPGTLGKLGAFSFNGNKIITTSGGGMLVTDDKALADHARKLATQAREPVAHYEHTEIGYNYRMSNIVAAIGVGQLAVIEERVRRKREIYAHYRAHLADVAGLTFVDEMAYGRHNRWLTVLLVDAEAFGADREAIRLKLEEHNIESRPLWKPMHCQPVYQDYEAVGGAVAESLFDRGLCLPSGTALTDDELEQIAGVVRGIGSEG